MNNGFCYWVLDHLHALSPHLGDNGGNVYHTATCSRVVSMTISMPVLPLPALKGETIDSSFTRKKPFNNVRFQRKWNCVTFSGLSPTLPHCMDLQVCEGDIEWTILFGPFLWLILLTLLLSPLHSTGYHGNHMNSFLPVSNSVWEGTCKVQSFKINAHS